MYDAQHIETLFSKEIRIFRGATFKIFIINYDLEPGPSLESVRKYQRSLVREHQLRAQHFSLSWWDD